MKLLRWRKSKLRGFYSGPVVDSGDVLVSRKLASADLIVREDARAVLKLICEDGSSVEFRLTKLRES